MTDNGQFCEQAALFVAEADPIRAARILASGLAQQTLSGQVSTIRLLIVEIGKREPDFLAELKAALS